jgi:hypothetical protein
VCMIVCLSRSSMADCDVVWLQNNTASDFGGGIAFVQSPGVTLNLASSTVSNNKVTLPMSCCEINLDAHCRTSPGWQKYPDPWDTPRQADAGGGLYGDNGVVFASTGLRQTGNTATTAATASLGCGSCSSGTNGAAAASVNNAAAFSTSSNTVVPGMLLASMFCAQPMALCMISRVRCDVWPESLQLSAMHLASLLQGSQVAVAATAASLAGRLRAL